ncbi:MAG: hypothetical protein IPL22_22800 [Bacteroidetes bacterium]|nr:hypothetical protein [Bacteroidota bacterium]
MLAQKPDVVTGEFELQVNDAISILELKEDLITKAKAMALQNKYGTSVMHIENMIFSESSGTATDEKFWSATETQSRGIWLCDIENPEFENFTTEEGNARIKVNVKGYAVPSMNKQTKVHAAILSCPETDCDAFVYPENGEFHIFFQSNTKGFLLVFVEDNVEQKVYGIGNEHIVSTFLVNADSPLIIPEPNSQGANANMKFTLSEGATSSQHIFRFLLMETKPVMPAGMSNKNMCDSEEFRQWLLKLVVSDELLALETISVTVIK